MSDNISDCARTAGGGVPSGVWIVVPAYNECARIGKTIRSLDGLGARVVVVDDGSSDATAGEALAAGAEVVRHAVNLGQGAALRTGMEHALRSGAAHLVTFDADGQHHADEIMRLLSPLFSGRADAALGSRFAEGGRAENIPPVRRVALRLAVLLTRLRTGMILTDTHNGFRAFTAEAARRLEIRQNRMAHAGEILQEIRRKRIQWIEVPVTITYTTDSLAKGQRLSNAFNILWDSFMEVFRA